MRLPARFLLLIPAVFAGTAWAKPPAPELLQGLAGCRAIGDKDQKLACFERETDALIGKTERREVVVEDREKVRLRAPEIPDQVKATIESAQTTREGFWQIELADGTVWRTTEGSSNARMPRPGLPVVVRKGAMGGYMLSVDGQRGIRAVSAR